ncbi:MAG: M4 family metallopeptidase [Roseiflexaceae bacterium]|nr:M4 family metallopeptidase [Roseiflexaceae bacterium]
MRWLQKWQAALFVALLCGALPPAQAFSRPLNDETDARRAFAAFAARAGAVDVVWDDQQQIVEFLAADGDGTLPFTPAAAERGDPVLTARGFLEQNRALFGLASAAGELELLRVEPDPRLGWSHVRFNQVYQGIPVFGRQLVVHLDQQLRPVAVNGQFASNLDVPTEALVSADQAAEVALRDIRETQLEPIERLKVEARVLNDRSKLMVYIDRAGEARLAWAITTLTEQPLGQWISFVHARRPYVIHAIDSLNHAKRRVTYSAENSTRLPGRKLIDEGERSRDEIAQAAHDNAGVVYDYFFKNFQRDSIDGQGLPIVSTVHYGRSAEDAENAAWIGELKQMIYGDGGRIFQPLSFGLDVVAHELTHGVTDYTAQLIYEGQSGALNESYSDVFGALIDDKNWTIGEQVVKSPPYPVRTLRDMEDPTLGGRYDPREPLAGIGQPGSADQYANLPVSRQYDNGGVHINSGISNRAMYLVAQAIGREKTAQIYYRTLTQYMTPSADFFDHATATVRAAQDLYGAAEVQAVQQAFAGVGIDAAGAETLPAPEEGDGNLPNIPTQPTPDEELPAGCSDIIVNGGFESETGWQQATAGEVGLIDSELPYSGKRSAWLGGTDQEPLQIIYQEVRLPPNASSVEVSYFRLIHEEFTGLGGLLAGDSFFTAFLATPAGETLGEIERIPSTEGDDEWQQASADLSEFAGKTVRLGFAAETTRGNVSSMFVDDVVLAVCTTGSAPAPRPSDSNQVLIEGTITNSDTGRGISGAQVFILNPSTSASQAARDGEVTADEVLTYGTTDNSGIYRTEASVPKGQRYSVIILAGGFRPIAADNGIDVPANAPSPLTVDATMRRGR